MITGTIKITDYINFYRCTKASAHISEGMSVSAAAEKCGFNNIPFFTKTFKNGKGEITEVAHYYSHEHTGSYDSLFYDINGLHLYVSVLIRWHMQPYFWEKDSNEKLHNKYKNLWGEQLYNDIMLLHESDKNSH